MSSYHAPLKPSAAAQWFYCPGSVVMQMYYPGDDTPEAKEGRASHEIGEEMVRGYSRGTPPRPFSEFAGRFSGEGVPYDIEMHEGALMYAEECRGLMIKSGVFGGEDFRVEEYVPIGRVHEANGGTPDFVLNDRRNRTLHVVDYKYGHRLVEVFENLQLVDYAIGLLDHYGIDGLSEQHYEVEFTVVQPRGYHPDGPVRTWACKASDLRALANGLHASAWEAMSADAKCVTGRHCRDCTARHACPAAIEAAYDAMQFTSDPVPTLTDPTSVGQELRLLTRAFETMKYRKEALEQQVESYAREGKLVPHWRLKDAFGHTRWAVDPEEVFALGDLCGVDIRKPREAITPRQAIKLGIDEAVIKGYIQTPRRGVKLVEDDTNDAKKVFGNG